MIVSLFGFSSAGSWEEDVSPGGFSQSDESFSEGEEHFFSEAFEESVGVGSVGHNEESVVMKDSVEVFHQKESLSKAGDMLKTCCSDHDVEGFLFLSYDEFGDVFVDEFHLGIILFGIVDEGFGKVDSYIAKFFSEMLAEIACESPASWSEF